MNLGILRKLLGFFVNRAPGFFGQQAYPITIPPEGGKTTKQGLTS